MEDGLVCVGLGNPLGLDEPLGLPSRLAEIEPRGAGHVACRQLFHGLDKGLGPLDARLLLGRARLGATAQPLGLAAQGIAHRRFLTLLRRHQLLLALKEGGVVSIDGQKPALVATIQFQDAVRDTLKKEAIVRDRDGGEGRLGQELLKPQDAFHVQVVGGLVEQQQLGLAHQLARQGHALAPAARQALDERLGAGLRSGQLQAGNETVRARRCLPLVIGVGEACRWFQHRLAHGLPRTKDGHLGHVPHAQPPAQRQLALIGRVHAGQDAQQGGLARTVGADEPDALALGQGKPHALEQGTRRE